MSPSTALSWLRIQIVQVALRSDRLWISGKRSDLLQSNFYNQDYSALQIEGCDKKGFKIAIIVRVEPSDSPKDQQQLGSGGPHSPKKQSDSPPSTQASTAPKQVIRSHNCRLFNLRQLIYNGLIDRVMVTEIYAAKCFLAPY